MKRKKAAKPTPVLSAPPPTAPTADAEAPLIADRKPLKSSSFVVSVEGFHFAGFHRCSPIAAHVPHVTLMRNVASGDDDIANWWNEKNARNVTLFLVDANGKAVRKFALGPCTPVNYVIGPFDGRSDAELEENITIQRATVEPAPKGETPPKAKA